MENRNDKGRSTPVNMNFKERMEHYENKKKKNTINVTNQVLANEKAQCPFTPKINSSSRRNLQMFLREQEEFLARKSKKIKNIKLELMEREKSTLRNSPRINRSSIIMCSNKAKSKRHNRSKARIEIPEKTIFKKSRNSSTSQRRLFEYRSTAGLKTIKQAKEELELQKQKQEENNIKLKRKHKENNFLKRKIGRELDTLLSIHNPRNSTITFQIFCNKIIIVR